MKLDLELKDDFIKRFVDLYNMALKCDDLEMMDIFHEAMDTAAFDSMAYSLKKVLNL